MPDREVDSSGAQTYITQFGTASDDYLYARLWTQQ